jgi:hypothetical protein
MFPYSNDSPSGAFQPPEISLISQSVITNLIAPKWCKAMLPCREPPTVPEIAVDKHYKARLAKDQIRLSRQ